MNTNRIVNKKVKAGVVIIILLCLPILSCNDNDNQDMEYPVIAMNSEDASPLNCDVVYRGESFSVKAIFTDNQELGSYNIEIHNNFDHHSHSTENEECEFDPKKKPVQPFIYNKDYVIPEGLTYFAANNTVEVPADIDIGDYHFMIRLTDKAGWQTLKSMSIKIRDKNE